MTSRAAASCKCIGEIKLRGASSPSAWLRRLGYWVEHLRAASPDEIEAQRRHAAERRAEADVGAVVDAVRGAVQRGQKPAQSQIEDAGALDANGRGSSPAAHTRSRHAGDSLRPPALHRFARREATRRPDTVPAAHWNDPMISICRQSRRYPRRRFAANADRGWGTVGIYIPPSLFPIRGGGIWTPWCAPCCRLDCRPIPPSSTGREPRNRLNDVPC